MRFVLALLFVTAAFAGRPDVVDRIAVTVGNRAITNSHIDDEIRLTALLNDEAPQFDPATRRAAADRLVERQLLRREMEITRYANGSENTAKDAYADVKARYLDEAAFQAALAKARLTEDKLRQFIEEQSKILLFIDFRFRPAVSVSDTDARRFYDTEYPAFWAALHPTMPQPPFEEARDDVERLLIDRKVDAEMDAWLVTAKSQTRVVYHQEAFE